MDFEIITQPTEGVLTMLEHRSAERSFFKERSFDTVGLVQGKLVEILVAADIAEKASGVDALEIRGICPQHFTMIAILGDTAAVQEAMDCIQARLQKG